MKNSEKSLQIAMRLKQAIDSAELTKASIEQIFSSQLSTPKRRGAIDFARGKVIAKNREIGIESVSFESYTAGSPIVNVWLEFMEYGLKLTDVVDIFGQGHPADFVHFNKYEKCLEYTSGKLTMTVWYTPNNRVPRVNIRSSRAPARPAGRSSFFLRLKIRVFAFLRQLRNKFKVGSR